MDWQASPVIPTATGSVLMNNGGFYAPEIASDCEIKSKSVAFSEFYSGGDGGSYYSNRGNEYAAIQHVPETNGGYLQGGSVGRGGYYSEEVYPSYYEYPQYAPCEGGPGPWNFNYCYGFFGEAPCPYANVIDMEDFM